MKMKSVMSVGLAAAAVALIAVTPAQARNNNQYLNNLAMQMYLQNQATAAAYNPYVYGSYPYTNYNYGAYPYGYGYAAYNGVTYPSYYAPVYRHHRHWCR